MEKASLIYYTEWSGMINTLPDDLRLKLYDTIFNSKENTETNPHYLCVYEHIIKKINQNNKKYEDVLEKRKLAGVASGKARQQKGTKGTSVKSVQQKGTKGTSVKSVQQEGTKGTSVKSVQQEGTKGTSVKSVQQEGTKGTSVKSVQQEGTKRTDNDNDNGNGNGSVNDNVNIIFEVFWSVYDYKTGNKEKIKKKWDSLKDVERESIIEYLPAYKLSTPDKQFRKQPATFLNNRSWEDEIVIKETNSDNFMYGESIF